MESELSPDKVLHTPPVPIKTYQWEDLRRSREAGAYPWTHLLKPPLEGEVTAEDIIRETTPRRSMSRDVSRSRTHTPDHDMQKILHLDSSPGSSRRHGEEGEDEGVHIPNFSKEVSLDSEDDALNQAVKTFTSNQITSQLATPLEIPRNVSPKSILKRRTPEPQFVPVSETREKTKCCHPLVNKIKHLADKTLHKLEKNDGDKSPLPKRKKNASNQEIRQLKSSPGAVRRQKFSAIKLGDSDEMSKTMSIDTTPPLRKKKEHIYEDIEENKSHEAAIVLQFVTDGLGNDANKENNNNSQNENDSAIAEKKSNASQDPSLITEDNNSDLRPEEHVMEKLHKIEDIEKEALVLDFDADEPNIDEIFQNQLDEDKDSPNITISEIIDEETEEITEEVIIRQPSQSPCAESPQDDVNYWSKPNSDHEYEVIEKPPPEIIYTAPSVEDRHTLVKKDDELSSTTSLERKYLQHTSDEEEILGDGETEFKDEDTLDAEASQRDIEDRYFVNTPSTVSRTECEISTSQVDSSALENLPLKRENRTKNNGESSDNKFQLRLRESTDKIKCQAGKLKTKLQSIKAKQFSLPDKPKIKLPDRSKFKISERPKFSFPDRSKFTLPDRPKFSFPDRRKFSLPDRPKFKKINISEKLSLGDRKKFSFPERPKFNVPDLPKFKFPEKAKVNFPSFSKKKEVKVDHETTDSNTDLRKNTTTEFETKTYPRLFKRKKKSDTLNSSSPTLNREETPPPTFMFTRVGKDHKTTPTCRPDSPVEPREYGNSEFIQNQEDESVTNRQYAYDFDKRVKDCIDSTENIQEQMHNNQHTIYDSDISPNNQEYTHVINEINNDEFFVRPRGISRENIQVREYLSDEIRQAFKIPKNALALMGNKSEDNDEPLYANDAEADPDLYNDENEPIRYSNEDVNERDDGYYTFPPVRPNRAKRKKKDIESVKYIDESYNTSMQFSEVDLGVLEDQIEEHATQHEDDFKNNFTNEQYIENNNVLGNSTFDVEEINYSDHFPIHCQTLPSAPKRKKKNSKESFNHSSLDDFKKLNNVYIDPLEHGEDIIVYRTEHEYIVPEQDTVISQQSPIPPRRSSRNRSRSSRGTSFCDDDRTSQGAESLILDTHISPEDIDINRAIRHDSPGYATVDKGGHTANKMSTESKTPPSRRRKSHSSERKYYTVGPTKESVPERPTRKKSATSLMTLDSITKRSASDITQYVEIDDPQFDEVHKDLNSGEIISKMRDRPLPPPPRPPRNSTRKKNSKDSDDMSLHMKAADCEDNNRDTGIVEIEVSTQTDPLPDDVDYELGYEENIDISVSSSLRDIVDAGSLSKSLNKLAESPRHSRPVSRSEKTIKLSDPKITELSKANIGRTSPTVILVERRVSSPTRINEHEEMVTEASLTVQHIDMDESIIPEVPPLPRLGGRRVTSGPLSRDIVPANNRLLDNVSEFGKEVQFDNLITQRLQVKDLDVGRLNVSELQASKILVSDIEGMTLQVAELDSKSGHISVSGIEFSQTIIDEIVKKFAELTPPGTSVPGTTKDEAPKSREEETQTDETQTLIEPQPSTSNITVEQSTPTSSRPIVEEHTDPPQRPPPPDLTPLLYSYLQDLSMPPASFYHIRTPRERPFTDFHESQQSPPPPTRRAKRRPAPHNESSSDDSHPRPSPRRMPPPVKTQELSISEAGNQFIRVCHNSICNTVRNMFNSIMSYVGGTEDKKDLQMALVIFLVLIAGLIMFGLSDSRTIHHHHWEFFNPPDGKK